MIERIKLIELWAKSESICSALVHSHKTKMRKVIKLTTISSEAINIGLLFLWVLFHGTLFFLSVSYKISSLRYIQLNLIWFINEIDVQLLLRLYSQLNGVALLDNCFGNYCHFDSILILYSIIWLIFIGLQLQEAKEKKALESQYKQKPYENMNKLYLKYSLESNLASFQQT